MNRSLLDIISLGENDSPVQVREWEAGAPHVDYAVLFDREHNRYCPVLAGFALFTEADPTLASIDSLRELKELEQQLFGDRSEYQRFVEQKWRRPNRDAYAAFQPFNESTRALYPLVPLIREQLRPGDYILDTWCRTGWSGELLAALFPEQTVVSLWEGNQGLLGYGAFRHWLSREQRAENLEILFHDVNRPFPFVSGSFAAVVGLDTLHRYDADNLLAQCQRICRAEAPILFPHVHLTNSEPDPWFDRGCRQEHGEFWNDYLTKAVGESSRRVYIESEMSLFNAGPGSVVANNPHTAHYNALVGLLPEQWLGRPLASIQAPFAMRGDSYVVVNPLLSIDLEQLCIAMDGGSDADLSRHIFERHPGYREFIAQRLPLSLHSDQARILYWAQKALCVGAIAERLDMSQRRVEALLQPLVSADVVLVLPVSSGMAALNHYYAYQDALVPPRRQTLPHLWRRTVQAFGDKLYVTSMVDDLELSYDEMDQLVEAAARRLLAVPASPGAPVVVAAEPALETVILFWAAQLSGRPFVAIDPGWSAPRLAELVQRHAFELVFTDVELPANCGLPANTVVISLESADTQSSDNVHFADWLEEEGSPVLPDVLPGPETTAVVLFTSGTTGVPKGVELSHRAIWQSALDFVRVYQWSDSDVYLSLGHQATMSGLRNPLICTALAGGRFVLPDTVARGNVLHAVSLIGEQRVSIMGVVPAFLSRLATLAQRLERASFASLRFFLSTAANLNSQTANQIEEMLGVAVRNYYGLTETCGACVFMSAPGCEHVNHIGRPVDAIAHVVTPGGELVAPGESGELRIYSGNLMLGYLGEAEQTSKVLRDGWFYTGDVCRWSVGGQLELLDRKKDTVKTRSGTLIYVSEIERCLQRHGEIEEVAVAGIIGASGDDQLVCFVQAQAAISALELKARYNQLLCDQLSTEHQLSTVVYVDAFPRGANEKIRKDCLINQYLQDIAS